MYWAILKVFGEHLEASEMCEERTLILAFDRHLDVDASPAY